MLNTVPVVYCILDYGSDVSTHLVVAPLLRSARHQRARGVVGRGAPKKIERSTSTDAVDVVSVKEYDDQVTP